MFIELKEINKKYCTGNTDVKALCDVTLSVKKGEILAVSGKSGSGKSTLLHVLAGLTIPESGEYYFNGEKIDFGNHKKLSSFRQKNIGIIIQNFGLIPTKTVFENIELPLKDFYDKKCRQELVYQYLDYVGITEKSRHYPFEISGGESQRVAIARALIRQPTCILADEPTSSLDKENSDIVINLLRAYVGDGGTVIIVTHDEYISNKSDRVIQMVYGKIENFSAYQK